MSDGRRFNGRTPRGLTPAQRFWAKVSGDSFEDCWLWTAGLTPRGYAHFQLGGGKRVYGHRWAYEQLVASIPDGLQLDHLCRNRACVNPWHLDPVTPLVNVRRGLGHGAESHCPHGHPYDTENTYRYGGRRHCRTCQSVYQAAYRGMTPEQRAARKAAGLPVVDLAARFAELARRETAA